MIKSFMEFVQLKNEGLFDFFKSKKTANAPAAESPANVIKNKIKIPLDTYDPYTAEYSPLTGRVHGSYTTFIDKGDKDKAEDQRIKNSSYGYGSDEKSDPALKYISQSQFAFPNGTKQIEDDIKKGIFSYDKDNVPKMMLYLLNHHLDSSYMPLFGSLVKNNAVNMIPYNLALRIMEVYQGSNLTTLVLKSFIARHLLEKTPNKVRNIKELRSFLGSLKPTQGWEAKSNSPSFLQHIKEEDIKDIWLKFFEKRPDLAQKYYEENGEIMRLNQKYKQANDLRYQKPNDMENAISIIVGEKNESYNPCKKPLYDW